MLWNLFCISKNIAHFPNKFNQCYEICSTLSRYFVFSRCFAFSNGYAFSRYFTFYFVSQLFPKIQLADSWATMLLIILVNKGTVLNESCECVHSCSMNENKRKTNLIRLAN